MGSQQALIDQTVWIATEQAMIEQIEWMASRH